jgi:hypothetical protein
MSDPTPPTSAHSSAQERAERHAVARYGIVLILLLATFVFMASAPTGHWVPFVGVMLQSATLVAAL